MKNNDENNCDNVIMDTNIYDYFDQEELDWPYGDGADGCCIYCGAETGGGDCHNCD